MPVSDVVKRIGTTTPWGKDGDRILPENRTPAIDRATGWTAPYGTDGGPKPSRRVFNQLMFEMFSALQEIIQSGVLEWDTSIAYEHPAIVRASDGNLYESIRDNTGKNPISSPGDWRVWPSAPVTATTTVAGVVELATNTEAAAATATDRAVTPSNLPSFRDAATHNASTTQRGFVRLATSAEKTARSGGGVVTVSDAAELIG